MFIRASKIKSFLHPKKSLVFPSLRILSMNRTAAFWYSGSLSRIRILLGLWGKSILVWLSLLESTTVFSCAGLSARFRSQNLANLERKGNACVGIVLVVVFRPLSRILLSFVGEFSYRRCLIHSLRRESPSNRLPEWMCRWDRPTVISEINTKNALPTPNLPAGERISAKKGTKKKICSQSMKASDYSKPLGFRNKDCSFSPSIVPFVRAAPLLLQVN